MAEGIEDAARRDWDEIQEDVYSDVEDAAARAHSRLAEAAGSLEETYHQVSEDAVKLMRQARRQASRQYAELEERLKEQPILGVGLGVVIGMLVALTLTGGPRTVIVRDRYR